MATLLEPAHPGLPDLRITSYRYWDRFTPEELAVIAAKIALVRDDKTRQFDLFVEPKEENPVEAAAVPAAAFLLAPEKNLTLGTVLSPSQVKCFLDCSARWWFKYALGLPDPKSGSLVRGLAVHKLVEWWIRRRMNGAAPDVDDLADPWDEIWEAQADGAAFGKDEDPEALKKSGARLVRLYLDERGATLHPAIIDGKPALELPVQGEIAGVPVRGYIDMLELDGTIRDLKTASKSPSGVSPDYAFQLATYRQLAPGATGKARLDTVVDTKTPKLVQIEYTVTIADQLLTQHLYPKVRGGIREGLYYPNRCSNLCSRKYCAFADACEKEFGGVIQ